MEFGIKEKSINPLGSIEFNSIFQLSIYNYALFVSFLQNHFCVFITTRLCLLKQRSASYPQSVFFSWLSTRQLTYYKAGLIAQLDLFLKRPQGCGQETHSKSLILPDKKVMKPNNGSQVTPCAHHEVHHLIQLDQNLL